MFIDWKTAISLAGRRYIAPMVVVILATASGMNHVWSDYKQLQKEKELLASERKLFYEDRLLSERNRVDAATVLLTKQAELDRREFTLQQLEAQNKERLAALQQRAAEYEVAAERLEKTATAVSQSQRLKDVDEKLQRLMSEFSAMGVNLNDALRCGDSEALARHNAAKAKYTEIYALAEAWGLNKLYKHFFFTNGQSTYSACTK